MANGYQCDLITNNITGLPVCPHFGFAEVNMGIHAQRNMDMVIFMEHVINHEISVSTDFRQGHCNITQNGFHSDCIRWTHVEISWPNGWPFQRP